MVDVDLSELPSDVIRTALCETIERQLNSNKYKISITSASTAGENNFVGVVYRVAFSKDGETDRNASSKLILKVAPQNLARRTQFMSRTCFLREIYMYNEVLPYFREFEASKGVIVEENGFIEYPICYRTVDEEPSECVLLEDLSVRDLHIIDRHTEEITADHVRLVMQVLGKFHAISFALKDQQPEKFKKLSSNLDEVFIRRNDPFLRDYFVKQTDSVINVLSSEEDAHLVAKVKKLFEKHAMDIAADCLELEPTGSATVITHGDAWQNNTMFRYDKNGKPIEISLLDWQISRHSSPIIDIVYYMFCCTTKELRDAHYDDFLKVYHESLSAHIQRLGSDVEKLFPYKLMMEHFQKFAKFGLLLATMLLPMLTTQQGNGINLDEMAEKVEKGEEIDPTVFISDKSRSKFTKRMRDVVIDMVRLDYI